MSPESNYLDAWLERIERKVDNISALTAELPALRTRLDEHISTDERMFHGDGNSSGLVKDVDRLKQWRKLFTGTVSILATAVAAELAKIIWWGK